MMLKDKLIELNACLKAREWAGDKDIKSVIETCERGDWLLWLAYKIGVDHRKLTLTKALCAKTVLHLMKDERSKNAVEIAEKYGNGLASKDELAAVAAAAYAAAYDASAYAASAYAAASAAIAAYDAAATAAYAAADDASAYAAAYAAIAAYDAAYDAAYAAIAMKENRMQTANICREILTDEILSKF